MLADESIGAEAAKERTLLESWLGGTRNNRVFAFFYIEAPQRAADARLAEAEEKKKAKVEPSGATGGKHKKSKGGSSTEALEKKKMQERRWGKAFQEAFPPPRHCLRATAGAVTSSQHGGI